MPRIDLAFDLRALMARLGRGPRRPLRLSGFERWLVGPALVGGHGHGHGWLNVRSTIAIYPLSLLDHKLLKHYLTMCHIWAGDDRQGVGACLRATS